MSEPLPKPRYYKTSIESLVTTRDFNFTEKIGDLGEINKTNNQSVNGTYYNIRQEVRFTPHSNEMLKFIDKLQMQNNPRIQISYESMAQQEFQRIGASQYPFFKNVTEENIVNSQKQPQPLPWHLQFELDKNVIWGQTQPQHNPFAATKFGMAIGTNTNSVFQQQPQPQTSLFGGGFGFTGVGAPSNSIFGQSGVLSGSLSSIPLPTQTISQFSGTSLPINQQQPTLISGGLQVHPPISQFGQPTSYQGFHSKFNPFQNLGASSIFGQQQQSKPAQGLLPTQSIASNLLTSNITTSSTTLPILISDKNYVSFGNSNHEPKLSLAPNQIGNTGQSGNSIINAHQQLQSKAGLSNDVTNHKQFQIEESKFDKNSNLSKVLNKEYAQPYESKLENLNLMSLEERFASKFKSQFENRFHQISQGAIALPQKGAHEIVPDKLINSDILLIKVNFPDSIESRQKFEFFKFHRTRAVSDLIDAIRNLLNLKVYHQSNNQDFEIVYNNVILSNSLSLKLANIVEDTEVSIIFEKSKKATPTQFQEEKNIEGIFSQMPDQVASIKQFAVPQNAYSTIPPPFINTEEHWKDISDYYCNL